MDVRAECISTKLTEWPRLGEGGLLTVRPTQKNKA